MAPNQLNLFRKYREPKPRLMSFKHISTETLGYSIFLQTWSDGTMTIGVGGRKRTTAILTAAQVDELTRTLQSMKTEL